MKPTERVLGLWIKQAGNWLQRLEIDGRLCEEDPSHSPRNPYFFVWAAGGVAGRFQKRSSPVM